MAISLEVSGILWQSDLSHTDYDNHGQVYMYTGSEVIQFPLNLRLAMFIHLCSYSNRISIFFFIEIPIHVYTYIVTAHLEINLGSEPCELVHIHVYPDSESPLFRSMYFISDTQLLIEVHHKNQSLFNNANASKILPQKMNIHHKHKPVCFLGLEHIILQLMITLQSWGHAYSSCTPKVQYQNYVHPSLQCDH